MKIFKLLLITGLLISSSVAKAQYYEPEKKEETNKDTKQKLFKDRLHFGGSLGLQFGSFTSIYISPIAFYDVTDKLMVGAGFNYIYQKYKRINEEYKSSIYGPRFAAFLKPFDQIMLSTEYEHNFYNKDYGYFGAPIDTYWQGTWYVGVGYMMPMGRKGGMYISISYDLLHDPIRSYSSSKWRPTVGVYF